MARRTMTPERTPIPAPIMNPTRRPVTRMSIEAGMVAMAVPRITSAAGIVARALWPIPQAMTDVVAMRSSRDDPNSI